MISFKSKKQQSQNLNQNEVENVRFNQIINRLVIL